MAVNPKRTPLGVLVKPNAPLCEDDEVMVVVVVELMAVTRGWWCGVVDGGDVGGDDVVGGGSGVGCYDDDGGSGGGWCGGGAWWWGSDRSVDGEAFGTWSENSPEKFSGDGWPEKMAGGGAATVELAEKI
ncbi:hypothetical protein Tco_1501477 [Tanacetum coccineum]